MRPPQRIDPLALLVMGLAAIMLAFACDISFLNEQEQGPTQPRIEGSPPAPTASIEQIAEVRVEKNEIGACDTADNEISASCADPALITCRPYDEAENVVSEGFQPGWFSQAPVTVSASNVNVWNARAICDTPGQTGSVICIVTVIGGDPSDQVAAEKFLECVP